MFSILNFEGKKKSVKEKFLSVIIGLKCSHLKPFTKNTKERNTFLWGYFFLFWQEKREAN